MRQKFLDSLMDLVDDGIEALGEEAVAELLWDSLVELDPATYRFDCEFSDEDGSPRLTLSYRTPLALRRDLEKFTEVCGLMVEVEPAPPLMESLEIVATGAGVDERVGLSGRAVHQANREIAVELYPEDDTGDQLEALADRMRQVRDRSEQDIGPLASSLTTEDVETVDPPDEEDADFESGRPAVDQLVDHPEDIERRWRLEEADIEQIVRELADLDGYGFLEIADGDQTIQYVLHYGKLIDVRRDPPVDTEQRLIDELVDGGWVDDEEVERAGVLASIHDIPVQDALVDMDCLGLEDLLDGIRRRLREDLDELWSRTTGEARLFLLDRRPPLRLRRSSIDLVEHLVARIRRRVARWPDDRLQAFRRDVEGSRVRRPDAPPFDVERLGLNNRERRFVRQILDEPRSMFELDRISNLNGDETLRLLMVLDQLEMLERCEQSRRRPEHDKIEELHATLDRTDHFEVLGVHWSAHGEEIEEAYRELRELLDVPDDVHRQFEDEIEELREAASKARAVLSDPESRRRYRDEQVDRSARQSALNVYKDKAEAQQMRDDKSDLMDSLRRIVELEPDNREARRKLKALEHARQQEDAD